MPSYSPSQFARLLQEQFAGYLVVGVTGHRDLFTELPRPATLPVQTREDIQDRVLAKLRQIRQQAG